MSKSDCLREYQYLVKTSKHHLAHSQEQVEKNDPSCEICWPNEQTYRRFSSDTTIITLEDEQQKENNESNESKTQRSNKEAKNKKKENNEKYIESSNLNIRDTSKNPIGNSKSILSSSTLPLQLQPSFRYNDLYDESSITVPRDFSFLSRYGLHDEENDQNRSKFYSRYQRKSNFGSSIRSSTPKQSLNQPDIAGQATQNSGSTPNWMKDLNSQEQSIFELVAKAKEYFDRNAEPRKTRLVDFPEFKGGNQDPVEWLEAFERACDANKVPENRKVILVTSYLKGTALT
ncbi:hypothetical protein RCL_jg22030.t1 [Rhizophagus clarus]|uniref:Retrotransposon gag domain-containing protein n=1 Tax=Rhizophagus clarus TaxID=94130 RepID=A0A8H3QUU0_9GLOM|nr:hypothetical protein RCL_jg22030.t1 [Rhizophagus clarus]